MNKNEKENLMTRVYALALDPPACLPEEGPAFILVYLHYLAPAQFERVLAAAISNLRF